jgi:hypothetical protein
MSPAAVRPSAPAIGAILTRDARRLRIARRLPAENTEPSEPAEKSDETEPAEPTENAEAMEPTEPMERTEPQEPTERTEPYEPTERIESREAKESIEFLMAVSCPPGMALILGNRSDEHRPVRMMLQRELVDLLAR